MSDSSASAKLSLKAEKYSATALLKNKYDVGMEVFNETSVSPRFHTSPEEYGRTLHNARTESLKAFNSFHAEDSSQKTVSGKQLFQQHLENRISDLSASHKHMYAYVRVVNVSDRVEKQYMRKLAEIAQSVSRFSELREKHNVLLKEAKKSFDEQTEDLNPDGDKHIAQDVTELKERLENKIEELCSIIGDLALSRCANPPHNTMTTKRGTVERVASSGNTVTTRKGDVIPRDDAHSKTEATPATGTEKLPKKMDNEGSSTLNSKKDPKMTLETVADNCKQLFVEAVEPLEKENFVAEVECARKKIIESHEAELKKFPDCSRIMRRRQEEALSDVLDRIHCDKAKSLTIGNAVVKLSKTRTNNVEAVVADAMAWYITATEQVGNKQIRKKGLEECQEKIQEFANTPMARPPHWVTTLPQTPFPPFTTLIRAMTAGPSTSGRRNQPQ